VIRCSRQIGFIRHRAIRLGASSADRPKADSFDELYERFAQPESWSIYEDVLPTIETLIDRGIDLGIISNWDERLRPLLKRLKIDGYFRVIIISQEIGFQKPSDVIFHEAVRKFTCPASCVLHVGDGEMEDMEGARRAGLQSALLRRNGKPRGDNTLTSLSELISLFH
jgi:putative hydrolase of the HAD superfamily